MTAPSTWVNQDPSKYDVEIYLNNVFPYHVCPPPLPVFGPLNRPINRVRNYRNHDLLFLLRGSTARRDLEPSLKCTKEIAFDEDDLKEIFEYRYIMEEVPKSKYDSKAMYMIKICLKIKRSSADIGRDWDTQKSSILRLQN
ncbi:hypothetical protein Tco_0885394 [Tanacetum coccineum]